MKKKVVFVFFLVLLTVGVFAQSGGIRRLRLISLNGVDKTSAYTGRVDESIVSSSTSVSLDMKDGTVENYMFYPSGAGYTCTLQTGNASLEGTANKIQSGTTTQWSIRVSGSGGAANIVIAYGHFNAPTSMPRGPGGGSSLNTIRMRRRF